MGHWTLELSQIHGKPWYPVSYTFLSLNTVEFYSKPYGLLPQDFNLGQIYCILLCYSYIGLAVILPLSQNAPTLQIKEGHFDLGHFCLSKSGGAK